MRYLGQGHEIAVPLPAQGLGPDDAAAIRDAYETEYRRFFDRPVPGSDVEVMSWAVTVATPPRAAPAEAAASRPREASPVRHQRVRDSATGGLADLPVFDRAALAPGARLAGPAIIAEDETSTLIGAHWHAAVDANGYLHLAREATP
jgi:N-methylhydantoinase A